MQTIDPAVDIAIDHRVREFLKALNSGGGKPSTSIAGLHLQRISVICRF
jgi:hypothetical protein